MVLMLQFATVGIAVADTPVRIRTDGQIIDIEGNIIAVPNKDDPRNTDYEKYYSNLGPDGKPSGTSDFYIISDINAGYLRKEINPAADAPPPAANPPVQTAGTNNPVINPGHTILEIYDDPSIGVYDNVPFFMGSVYDSAYGY